MKIARVAASALHVPIEIDVAGVRRSPALSVGFVEIETDDGLVGHGITGITEEEVITEAINAVCAPALIGADPLANERIWERLYWLMSPRGQTGYASHAIAAIDVALWDIKGKALGQPVWRLLGGARDRVPVYATFGFDFFDREQLAEAARIWRRRGFERLKMTVGNKALQRRDEPRRLDDVIAEDAARVRAVREAIGPEPQLFIDANCSLDAFHAIRLAQQVEPYGITFFEEPITQNDVRQMADMRRRTTIPLACGQNEGLAFRFRDLLVHDAVDVLQPNVVIGGGYSQCVRIAGMAAAFNVPIDNGGAWPFHNMHLHGGVANGGMTEMHFVAVECCKRIFRDLPEAEGGWLKLPDGPGLGFSPDMDAVRELAAAAKSAGGGKG